MNENDSPKNKSDEWKSWPPEFYLAVLLHELRTPIMTIKGWVKILSNENATGLHPKALEGISYSIAKWSVSMMV
jgi:signal transduction histidine kinase